MKRIMSMPAICLVVLLIPVTTFAQSSIPEEYRGSEGQVARGILEGNHFISNYRNHGEVARWGDMPWGEWYTNICGRFDRNCSSEGGTHLNGIGFYFAAEVEGERAKWPQFFGEGVSDTTLNPVIMNYRQAGLRQSPYNGDTWGWLPLNGFHNTERIDGNSGSKRTIPASSGDETSWPESWPDRLNQDDAGWPDSWNGFRGKGLVTGEQETFYVMDDFSDKEYHIGKDEGTDSLYNNSPFGVYYPSPSDSSMGGLGTQVEVRNFQFNDVVSADMLFTHYRITNVSEKDLDKAWATILVDSGLGQEPDDALEFLPELDLFIMWDEDGMGDNNNTGPTYQLGYVGFLLLEHSMAEDNGVDEDRDGITDESKFNGAGTLIEGKSAIDEYLTQNYNMELFESKHLDLSEFPAYAAERWWTGDEDLDWVAHEDFNKNGQQDNDESLLDDVGRDGLGPDDPNYEGPDEGEGDGMPTQGEPNFGEQDMLEAENRGGTIFDAGVRSTHERGNNLRDDTWFFDRIRENRIDSNTDYSVPLVTNDHPIALFGVGPYSLKANTSSYVVTALIFAENREELLEKVKTAQAIYESDYGQSKLVTGNESDGAEMPKKVSLSQNYPNPFNPTTNIQFTLNQSNEVSLKVYNITGQEVASLVSDQRYSSGAHTIKFDASELASGIYIYQLLVDGIIHTKKLTLIK